MCTIFLAYQQDPEYPLILLANRDEFLDREALPMHWWEEKGILAGRDVRAGGTWLAIDRAANFSLVTNYRDLSLVKDEAKSRGELPVQLITHKEFREELTEKAKDYNPFNLLYSSHGEVRYTNNIGEFNWQRLSPGIYGLSNAFLNTPWPKVEKGKRWLQKAIEKGDFSTEKALNFLADTDLAPAEQLPETGVPPEWELQLSALNIRYQGYGTRVSTVLTVNRAGEVEVVELNRLNGEMVSYKFKTESCSG